MTTKVYDIDGNERSLDWLRNEWDGCEVLPARIAQGVPEWWQLAAIYCSTGPAVLKAETRRGGTPAGNQPVVMTFPFLGNPSGELPSLPANPHNWSQRGVLQRTEGGGMTGFGLGETYGPYYHVWVLSSVPSDCLSKAGMKGGTPHNGPLHGVWVLTPVHQQAATLDEEIWNVAKDNQLISPNPNAAIETEMRRLGYIPIGNEKDVEWNGVWQGVSQLGYMPGGDANGKAFFATNLTPTGAWTVRMVSPQ